MALFDDLPGIIADVLGDADLGFATVVLTHVVTPGTYDPTTGTVSGGSSYTATIPGAPEDYKGLSLLPGSNIQAGDKKVTVAAALVVDDATKTPFTPAPGDSVTAAGITYSAINVATTEPGSAAVIYELQCRKA